MHNQNNISPEYILRYIQGKLNESEKNAFEKIMLDDLMLSEAVEGFQEFPEPLEKIVLERKRVAQKQSSTLLTIGIILTSLFIVLLLNLHDVKEPQITGNYIPKDSTVNNVTEIEQIPQFIDTLVAEPDSVIIKPIEVSTNKKAIQKKITYKNEDGNLPIVIEEEIEVPEDYELIPEGENLSLEEFVPATYLYDLFVVDYRRIEREKTEITYTKFELTGTPASNENSGQENNEELIETTIKVSYWEYLYKSMSYFANGNYKSALNRFLIILEQYPGDMNALFYSGISYFNLGSFNKAIEMFDRILINPLNAFKEESMWYKAKALIKLKRTSEAKAILETIISKGGFYAEDAILLLKKIK